EVLAEFTNRHRAELAERILIQRIEKQPTDIVVIGIDQRLVDNLAEAQIGKNVLGGDALALASGGQSSQSVSRLFLIGAGKDFTQIGEMEMLPPDGGLVGHESFGQC